MEPDEFREHIANLVAAVLDRGGDVYALVGNTPHGTIPVGVAAVDVMTGPNVRKQAMPHAWWFPEASPRNRVECSLRFLVDLKKEQNLLVIAEGANWRFFNHLCKYGVIRPIGKYWSYLEGGGDAMLYQGVNSEMRK